jgi:hypothetical protein
MSCKNDCVVIIYICDLRLRMNLAGLMIANFSTSQQEMKVINYYILQPKSWKITQEYFADYVKDHTRSYFGLGEKNCLKTRVDTKFRDTKIDFVFRQKGQSHEIFDPLFFIKQSPRIVRGNR